MKLLSTTLFLGLTLAATNSFAICAYEYVIQDNVILSSEFKCEHARTLPVGQYTDNGPAPMAVMTVPTQKPIKKSKPVIKQTRINKPAVTQVKVLKSTMDPVTISRIREIAKFNEPKLGMTGSLSLIDDIVSQRECQLQVREDHNLWVCETVNY